MKVRGKKTLVAGGVLTAAALAARRGKDDLRGEVAVVTGASRGLGLLLARELARHGCPVVICARDAAELDDAAAMLRAEGAEVTAVACDVTDEAAPQRLIDTAIERYGRLDILVSNAGIIAVGPVEDAQVSQYRTAIETMALAPVRLALAALPVMRRQGHGRIVTIASIGGKLSVPHLLPYSTAKFAAVGFSEGLRAELGRGPVTVTTVVPGLMRTGSHLQARFTGQAGKEFTWFALGASLPLISMDAERAAAQIIEAVRGRRPEIILTPAGQVVSRVAAIVPELTSEVMHLTQRLLLPAPGGDRGDAPASAADAEGIPGYRLNPALNQRLFDRLTTLGRAAARRFNERPLSQAYHSPVDITQLILDDHHEQRRLFSIVEQVDRSNTRALAAVWGRLAAFLEVHAAAEEAIFYPALLQVGISAHRKAGVEDETLDAIGDHNDIRDAVAEAARHAVGSDDWYAAVAGANQANGDHMAEEEREGLTDFRRLAGLQQRHDLAVAFVAYETRNVTGVQPVDKDPAAYIRQVEEGAAPGDGSLNIGGLRRA